MDLETRSGAGSCKAESSPIAICNMNLLPARSQSIGSRKVQNQLLALELFGSEDLEMIDILYRLENMQSEEYASANFTRKSSRLQTQTKPERELKEFTYEAFLANRIDNANSATVSGESIFADKYVSDVSRVLNRILGIVAPLVDVSEDEYVEDLRPTEYAHEDDILSDDFVSPSEVQPVPQEISSQQSQRHTVDMLLAAVARYVEARRQDTDDEVNITEIIYLRTLLQIILAFATPVDVNPTHAHVLPPFDKMKTSGWPRLIGKILTAFFGKSENPIAKLKIPKSAETIPTEIVDCWACIDVAAILSVRCASQFEETAFIARLLDNLSKRTTSCIEQSINHYPDAKERFEMTKSQFLLRFENLA